MAGYHIHRVKFSMSEGPVRLSTNDDTDPAQPSLILELEREGEAPLRLHLDLCTYSALRSVLDMTDNWWETTQTMLRNQARHESLSELFGTGQEPASDDDDDEEPKTWRGYNPN